MKLDIRNATDLPKADVRKLIRFALADLDLDGTIRANLSHTRISDRRRRRGGGRYGVYPATGEAISSREMDLRVTRPELFPCTWYDRYQATEEGIGWVADWREALVAIAAHEGKHLAEIQRGCPIGRRRQRTRSETRTIEARCDAYARARVNAYRELTSATAVV